MPKQRVKSGRGGWLFLTLTLLVYMLLGLIDAEVTVKSLTFFTHVMAQVLPMLGLVFLLLFIAPLLLEPKRIKRYLGRGSGIKGWIAAVLGGILSVGSIYAWYAMLSELKQKVRRTALSATFLYSSAIKLPLLPHMVYFFFVVYTLILCLYLIIFSVISGILV